MSSGRAKLRQFLADHSLIREQVTLSSGERSNYYFDCKTTTLDPEGASLLADEFLAIIGELPQWPDAMGGLTLGAAPIIGAVMMRAFERGQRLRSFYVRKDQKEHGTRKRIENAPQPGSKVIIVDDVITKGRSVIRSIDTIENHGCEVLAVVCLLDRREGGTEAIRRRCKRYYSLYTIDDFPEIRNQPATESSCFSSYRRLRDVIDQDLCLDRLHESIRVAHEIARSANVNTPVVPFVIASVLDRGRKTLV